VPGVAEEAGFCAASVSGVGALVLMIVHALAAMEWRMNARIEAGSPGLHMDHIWVPAAGPWS